MTRTRRRRAAGTDERLDGSPEKGVEHGLLSLMAAREVMGHMFSTNPHDVKIPLCPLAGQANYRRQTPSRRRLPTSIQASGLLL